MNYQQVKQFLTIVKHMNLSKAASELYISQPALSLALGRLESELNVQLFYRDGKKLIISPAGEQLHQYFVELKAAHDRLTDTADAFRKNDTNDSITIGFSISALLFSTLYMSGGFDSFHSMGINKIFADPEQTLTMLKNGMIDFAITFPPLVDDKISTQTILTENYVLVVSSGHPLAKRESISLAELKDVGLTFLKKHQPSRKHFDLLCEQNHFYPNCVHEYNYPEYYTAVKECAFTDRFASLIPEGFFEKSYGDGYTAIPLMDSGMVRQTAIAWVTEKKLNLECKDLFEYIISSFKSQQQYHWEFSEILSKFF